MWETWLWYLGRENPLKKEMVTHSSTLAWRISWTEKPGRLQSTGSQRVGHNWATSLDWTGLYWVFAYLLCSHLSLQLEYNLGETYFIWIFRTLDREQWEMNAAAAAKLLQSCPTLCDPRDGSPPGPPWDSPGKNTGVGCHFLLQCMKVKSESEVAQSCPTPSDPTDCSLPGSSVHGIFQARVLEWGAIAFSNGWVTKNHIDWFESWLCHLQNLRQASYPFWVSFVKCTL